MTRQVSPANFNYPHWVKWLAQDKDGSWWGYSVEPLENHTCWYENEVGKHVFLQKTEGNKNWKKSLIKIST